MNLINISECVSAMMPESQIENDSIVRGVKIIGFESSNGRAYSPSALRDAARLYEGVRVNLDHPSKDRPADSRSIMHRFGIFKNVKFVEGKGCFGDLYFNPEHAYAPTFRWFAKNQPEAIGFSHNAAGRGGSKDGKLIVEAITSVRSVDLVADPATTRSLFESEHPTLLDEATAVLSDDKTDNVEKLRRIKELLEGNETPKEPDMDWSKITLDDLKEHRADLVSQIAASAEKSLLEAQTAAESERKRIEKMLEDAKLPANLKTEVFVEAVFAAKDDATRIRLIEDRKALSATINKPRSRETTLQEATGGATGGDSKSLTMEAFVSAMKGNRTTKKEI